MFPCVCLRERESVNVTDREPRTKVRAPSGAASRPTRAENGGKPLAAFPDAADGESSQLGTITRCLVAPPATHLPPPTISFLFSLRVG